MINGTPGATNTDNFVNTAQLSQVTYKAGTGTDTLGIATAVLAAVDYAIVKMVQ